MPSDHPLPPAAAAVCGVLAGAASRLASAPLDVIKIRMMLQSHRRGGLNHAFVDASIKYRGLGHALRCVVQEEGPWALWKGNLAAMYLYMTYGGLQFVAYQSLERGLAPRMLAGGLAGATATLATYPFDLLRTRLASQGNSRIYTSLRHAVAEIYRCEGVTGFYHGLSPALVQIVPLMALTFNTYAMLQARLGSSHRGGAQKSLGDMACGALAGAISKTIVYPLDTVRKRLQVQGPTRTRYVVQGVPEYRGMLQALLAIPRAEGFTSLYKGMSPSLAKTALSTAVTFAVYDASCRLVQRVA